MCKFISYIFLLLIISGNVCSRKKMKSVTFLETHVEFCPTYLEDHTLKIRNNGNALDVVLNVAHNFTYDPWIDFGLAFKAQPAENFRNLVTYDLNICNVIGKGAYANLNLALIWINNFWKYGTMPKSCPILKGHYNWHGLKLDRASLPPFLSAGNYRAIINTYLRKENHGRDSVANLTVFIQVK